MILRTIGQGGMGAVYKAQDIKRQSVCAIKEMSLSMVPPEEQDQAVANFKAEAQMLANLKHINLPSVTGYFTEGARHFLVMEYIEGMTLDEYLEHNNAPFPERRVLGWARQLCDVLDYLHSQQPPIIFRDMKPGNIMLMRNGRVKLIDFGIARFFRHASSQDTQLLGTPGFAPPEQYGKAQTDERSDIYSLAMTLFQLMTFTLSEKGFGLHDVQSVNPEISLPVARALEKATALSPEDRFQSVDAFRRALLGEGTFMFENGDQATSAEELADLCERFPEEAAEYLYAGEIESWLQEMGHNNLAQAARNIRTQEDDEEEAVDLFLQAVLGPNVHIRSRTGTTARSSSFRNGRAWPSQKPAPVRGVPDITVQPRTLDFGEVSPGLSASLVLSITGDRGTFIQGRVAATEPWILLDRTSFDSVHTRVNVQVDTMRLRGSTHYSGTILVIPDEDDEEQDITVRVEVDVLGLSSSWQGASLNEYDDEEDEYDAQTVGARLIAPAGGSMTMTPPTRTNGSTVSPQNGAKYSNEDRTKYGSQSSGTGSATGSGGGTSGNTAVSAGWDPLQASPLQRLWVQRSLTVFAAFMVASLFYTMLSAMLSLSPKALLPPNPWFILVLVGSIPAATLGTLVVNWSSNWRLRGILNRLCTGASTALIALGLSDFVWQAAFHANVPALQLFVMLLVVALGAAVGTHAELSERMLTGVIWAMGRVRWLVISIAVVIGGILGFMLTVGFDVSCFTPFGILAGSAVAAALVMRVDQLMKKPY